MILFLCNGGMANRILPLASVLGVTDIDTLYFRPDNWFGAKFSDLFEGYSFEVKEFTQEEIDKSLPLSTFFLLHEIQYQFQEGRQIRHVSDFANYLNNDIVVMSNGEINGGNVLKGLSKLVSWIKPDILKRVKDVGSHELGVTLRDTDGTNMSISFNHAIDMARRAESVFVCSDSQEAENRFISSVPAAKRQENKEYVKKLVDGKGWNDTVVDDEGRVFPFNVNRGRKHCVDAFVDLLALSRCKEILGNPASSYFRLANYLKNFEL